MQLTTSLQQFSHYRKSFRPIIVTLTVKDLKHPAQSIPQSHFRPSSRKTHPVDPLINRCYIKNTTIIKCFEKVDTNIYCYYYFFFLNKCDFDTAAVTLHVVLYKRRQRQLETLSCRTFRKAISFLHYFPFLSLFSLSPSHIHTHTHSLTLSHTRLKTAHIC